jgi:ketosteroid isomerase-like protein
MSATSEADLAIFQALEDRFNAAMVSNDVALIARCMTDDWVLVTPEKGPIAREAILQAIASGTLAHDSMSKQVVRAKVYGDMAVVTGRGGNTGTFRGAPISADEWITDVYRRVDAEWRCVLTHLTPAH